MKPGAETLTWGGASEAAFLCPRCGAGSAVAGTCPSDGARFVALDVDEALVGRQVDGRFEITALLGAGGMGAVYRAVQRSVEREVALKVIRRARAGDAGAVRRFFREARAVSRLRHPNTVTLYDFGQSDDGLLWMAMELLEGDELSEVLAGGQRLPPERAVRIALQICDSLGEAHDAGLVHRDLKPENVMLVARHGHTDFVKVLDFGIAKALEGEESGTGTGLVTGTPAYMSPEACQGRPVDARADLYGLGVVLYQMLVGRTPFAGREPLATLLAHVEEPVPPSPHIPSHLAPVLGRLLAKRADDRPVDALAARRSLEQAMVAPAPPPRRRLPWLPVAAATAVTAGLSAWAVVGREADAPRPAPVEVAAAPVERPMPATAPGVVVPRAAAAPAVPPPVVTPRRDGETATAASRRSTADGPRLVVHVTSLPPGAAVYAGAERLGATPCDVAVWGAARPVTLRHPGYTDRALPLGDTPTAAVTLRRAGRGLAPL